MSARPLNDESPAGRRVNYLAVTRSILHNKPAAQPMRMESYPFCITKSMGFGHLAACRAISWILKGLEKGRRWLGCEMITIRDCCLGADASLLLRWVVYTAS